MRTVSRKKSISTKKHDKTLKSSKKSTRKLSQKHSRKSLKKSSKKSLKKSPKKSVKKSPKKNLYGGENDNDVYVQQFENYTEKSSNDDSVKKTSQNILNVIADLRKKLDSIHETSEETEKMAQDPEFNFTGGKKHKKKQPHFGHFYRNEFKKQNNGKGW